VAPIQFFFWGGGTETAKAPARRRGVKHLSFDTTETDYNLYYIDILRKLSAFDDHLNEETDISRVTQLINQSINQSITQLVTRHVTAKTYYMHNLLPNNFVYNT